MKLRRRWVTLCGILLVFLIPAFSQQTTATPAAPPTAASAALEWPVTFQQSISAGINVVGTKVQAKLLIPTQFNGTVVPADAVFSGEVIESQAKSATAPSKLAIRMNQVQWKNAGAFTVKLYLTHWYHPFRAMTNEQGPPQPYEHGKIGLRSGYPEEQSGRLLENPESPSGGLVSRQRLPIKNVEVASTSDGVVVLTSNKSNIKLDKGITYVLGAYDLSPQ